MTIPRSGTVVSAVLVVILSLLGGIIVLHAMRLGPWIGSDSVEYFEAANNLADGDGLNLIRASGDRVPLTLRPPLYPIILGIGILSGLEMVEATKILNVVLMIGFLLVLGISVQMLVGSSLLTLATAVLGLAAPNVHQNFTGAMTEPLFITFSIASLVIVVGYAQESTTRKILFLGAICAAAATTARFIGFTAVITGSFAVLLLSRRNVWRRVADAALFAGIGALPILVWFIAIASRGFQPGNADWPINSLWTAIAPVRIAVVDSLWGWFHLESVIPNAAYDPRLVTLLFIFLAVPFVTLAVMRRNSVSAAIARRSPSVQLAINFSGFSAVYLLLLTATYVFVAVPKPALIDRLLFAIPLFLGIGLLCISYFIGSIGRYKAYAGVVPLALSLVFAASNARAVITYAGDLNREGFGYSSQRWRESAAIETLGNLPLDRAIVSNHADAVLFFVGRPAFQIPELENGEPSIEYLAFGERPKTLAEKLFRENGAALALFDTAFWDFYELYGEATEDRLKALTGGLYLYADLSDGGIYFWDEANAPQR